MGPLIPWWAVPEHLGGHTHLDEVEDVATNVADPGPVLGHLVAKHAGTNVFPADVYVLRAARNNGTGSLDGCRERMGKWEYLGLEGGCP